MRYLGFGCDDGRGSIGSPALTRRQPPSHLCRTAINETLNTRRDSGIWHSGSDAVCCNGDVVVVGNDFVGKPRGVTWCRASSRVTTTASTEADI